MKHVFLLMVLSASSTLASTGGGFGGSARTTTPTSVVRSSPTPVVKSPSIPLQAPKASPQVKTFTGNAPSSFLKPQTSPVPPLKTHTKPLAPSGTPSAPLPSAQPHLTYSEVPTSVYAYEIDGRYYPHPYSYYQQHQWLGLLPSAARTETADSTPNPVETSPEKPQEGLLDQLSKAFNLEGEDPAVLKGHLIAVALAMLIGGILLSLNSMLAMMRIGNPTGIFLLLLGLALSLSGAGLLGTIQG